MHIKLPVLQSLFSIQNRMKAYFRSNLQSEVLVFWLLLKLFFKKTVLPLYLHNEGTDIRVLMKQTNILHLYLFSKWDLNSGWNKISFKKMSFVLIEKPQFWWNYIPCRKANPKPIIQGFDPKSVCFSRGRRVVERKQVWVWEKRSPTNKWGNESRGKKVQIPRHSRHIWYPLHPVLCASVVHISVFHRRGSCISVVNYYTKSFV